jgi:hypothetical protein
MVGYIPRKRQIIVYDDITTNGFADPRMYLYDLVTRSWTKGATLPAKKIDFIKTNFVNDWNGDLIYTHTAGDVLKWVDNSRGTTAVSLKTKDIDFGEPGVRKKVYKVYISYQGNAPNLDVQYAVNGDTDTTYPFYRTNSDGSSDKTNSDDTPLTNVGTDDWVLAELKPVVSSQANNIYSFQLVFDGGMTSDVKINDITIVYRLKGIR